MATYRRHIVQLSQALNHFLSADIVRFSAADEEFGANSLTAMYIETTSGNVGIGKVVPQGKLDVNGTILQRGRPVPKLGRTIILAVNNDIVWQSDPA